jgi:large subunit ribosomal protein L10
MAEYVTKLQQHKVDSVEAVKQIFQSAESFLLTDYRGLNVGQITELRDKLREFGTTYKVLKNRHVKIALKQMEYPDISDQLIGPTAVAFAGQDAGPSAKVLFDFAKEASLSIKGGIIDGEVFDGKQVEAYSRLPGRDVLISMLMSALNGPLTGLMYAMQAVPQKLVRTLQAVADQKEK